MLWGVTGLLAAFQSPRGDFGFLKTNCVDPAHDCETIRFQSPRGDFGFLKGKRGSDPATSNIVVSIPSRGFWFFEATWRGE